MVVGGIILARTLGPAGKGSYDLVIATTALLEVLLDFSLAAGVIYVVAKGEAAPGSLALRLMLIAPCQGLVAAVLLFFLQHTSYFAALLPPHMGGQAIAAVAISLAFTELAAFWRAILFGLQEIIKVNRLELISRSLFLLMLVATIGITAALRHRASAVIFVWVHVALLILTSLMFLYSLFPFLSRGKTGFRELIKFAFPCYLANFSQFLNFRLDVFMVSYFIGVEGVGLYTIAVNLAQVIWLIPQSAAKVLMPKVAASQGAASENAISTAQITRITLWVSLAVAFSLAIFARFMLPLVYGEAFRRSVAPFLWLLPGIVIFSTVNVLTSYIAGIGKPQVNLLISLAGLFFTITLDFLLIPRCNIIGAAMASTVSYSISAAVTIWFFRRQSGIGLQDILLITSEDRDAVISLLRDVCHRAHFKA
jgi:O-antigen/teichoic acid export membrane protein